MEYEYYTMMLGGAIFSSWRAVGKAESLATDTDIAKFLVDLYNQGKDKEQKPPGLKCSWCHALLAFHCTSCNLGHQPSQSPPTTQPLPVQVQTTQETLVGNTEEEKALMLQQNISSEELTVVLSDAHLLRGESTLQEVQSAVEQAVYVCDLQAKHGEWKTELVSELEEVIEAEDNNAFVVEQDEETGSVSRVSPFRNEPWITNLYESRSSSQDNIGHESQINSKALQRSRSEKSHVRKQDFTKENQKKRGSGMGRAKRLSKSSSKQVNKPSSGTDGVTNYGSLHLPKDFKKLVVNLTKWDVSMGKSWGCDKAKSKTCENGQRDKQACYENTDSQVLNSGGEEHVLIIQEKEKVDLNSGQSAGDPLREKELSGSLSSQTSASRQVHKYPSRQKAFPHQNQSIIHLLTGCEKAPRVKDDAKDLSSNIKKTSLKKRPFACQKCERTYLHKSNLRNHVLQIHPQCLDVESFECNLCYRKFFTEKGLARHKEKEHPQGTCLQCKLCDFKCRTYRDLKNHINRIHRKAPKRQCDHCGVYISRTGLRHHVLMHKNEKRYTCEDCGKKFIQKNALETHRRGHHAGIDRPYRCDQCGKGFLCEPSLRGHVAESHTVGVKPFPCAHCPCRFINKSKLNKHLKKHLAESERPHRCNFCGKGFIRRQQLTIHIRTHTGEKPFQCPHCASKFAVKYYLNYHLKAYHEGPDKPHRCQECGKGFVKNETLRDHMYSHTGEKPFQCPHCPSKFARKDYLNKHLETHPVEKHFECDICSRRFLFKSMMNVHKKNVHGVKKQDQQKNVPRVDTVHVMLNNLEDTKDIR